MYKERDLLHANKQIKKQIPNRSALICLYDITTVADEPIDHDKLRDFDNSKDKKFDEEQMVMPMVTAKADCSLTTSFTRVIRGGEDVTPAPFGSNLNLGEGFIGVEDRWLSGGIKIDVLFKPTADAEFFASEGITEVFRDIPGIVGLTAPNKYEQGILLRRKVKSYEAARDMFTLQ